MSIKRTSAHLSTSAAVLAAAVLAQSGSASGALTTRCVGEAGAVNVPGDLVVPQGKSCILTGTSVEGSVRVQPNADLLLEDGASVAGEVRVGANAYLEVSGSSVNGSVIGRGMYGAFIDGGTVGGDLQSRPHADYAGLSFVDALGANVDGSVDARTGEVFIESTRVGHAVTSIGTELTDLIDSTIGGDLVVRNNALGSAVCASEIYGNAHFQGSGYGLQLGGAGALGPCDGATFWGGDVVIARNRGDVAGIDVSNNIVAGSLTGDGNDPAPTGAGNRVRGLSEGQFGDLQPADSTQRRVMAAAPTDRDTRAAEQNAAAAGTAALLP